ncbi:MAG: FtsX-like permease family protein [Actinomycetota bacterium]
MEVIRLALRNLASNRLRVSMAAAAVMVGVAFVVASFLLSDGLRATFDDIIEDTLSEIDLAVRAESDFDEADFQVQTIDEALVDVVRGVDGVATAEPGLETYKIVPVDGDGDPVETAGPPIISANYVESTSSVSVDSGRAPTGPGEFTIDITAADRFDFEVGETYDVIGVDGREPFELVGTIRFGEDNVLGGAVLMTFELSELQRLDGREGAISLVEVVAEPGEDLQRLETRIELALPAGVEAVSSQVIIDEGQEDFGAVIDIFGNILLAFALVSVFVSTFIIANTFNILLGQRIRQLALLRALGASRRQVRVSALFEAFVIGLAASIIGLGLGVALAYLLRAIMNSAGFDLPALELILSARTIITAVVVGVGVSLLSAITPSRRAARVPPVAAMREGYRYGSGEGTRRTIIAIVLAVLGLGGISWSLFGDLDTAPLLVMMGGGAVLTFVSITMFTPLFSSPIARVLGAPLEHLPWLGVTGKMARENASSDNKRTARTAAGLMIGLALVAMASVVATSLKDSFRDQLGSTLTADYLITEPNGGGFSRNVAAELQQLDEFDVVSATRYGNAVINGGERAIAATDLGALTELLDVEVLEGDPADGAGPDRIALDASVVDSLGRGVGDEVLVRFASGSQQLFTINAIFDNEFLIANYVIDLSAWDEHFTLNEDAVVAARLARGVDEQQANAALASLESRFPSLEFETKDAFRERIEGQLDTLLVVINVFLGLAVVIALLGITNTMALAVLERTREIGLMRAVGLTRRQTRTMIRWEAAVVSVFGGILGVGVGVAFGWLAVQAIPDSIIDQLAVPVTSLVVYVVIAGIAGLIAASLPARRAARLDVLDAIREL